MVCRFCALCASSVHGVDVLCVVWTFRAWCARSVHGVDVPCMVWTFRAWCGRSVHGVHVPCMDAVSPLAYSCIYMYIEVAVCHFITTTSV